MASTLTQPDALTRLNAVQATSGKPLTGLNRGADILGVIRRVHGEMGVKQQYAAARAGVKESQYSAALSGAGNFSVVWLFAQDLPFLLRFVELAMEQYGLDGTNRKAQRATRIMELIRLLTDE